MTPVHSQTFSGFLPQEVEKHKWLSTALLVAGLAFIIGGCVAGVALGFSAFIGTVTISNLPLITFKVNLLALAIISCLGGVTLGFGALLHRANIS